MTLKSLTLVPFIAKGKNCAACIGAHALLHSFSAISLETSQGAFSFRLSERDPMRQQDCCGKLPSMRLHSLKCHLPLDHSSCGSRWAGFC